MLEIQSEILTKKCSDCKEDKLLSEFAVAKRNKYGRRNYCRPCDSSRRLSWVRADPSGKRTPWTKEKKRDLILRSTYGITLAEFNQMAIDQDYKCAICGKERRLVVDHSHETGKIRALLCLNCNSGIGLLEDSIDLLQIAQQYLRRFET